MRSIDYTSATITDTAGTILARADTGMVTAMPGAARSFVGILETAQIRGRDDGTAPTTTEGEVIDVGSVIYMSEANIVNASFIRTGATSGVIKGHFYDVDVTKVLGLR